MELMKAVQLTWTLICTRIQKYSNSGCEHREKEISIGMQTSTNTVICYLPISTKSIIRTLVICNICKYHIQEYYLHLIYHPGFPKKSQYYLRLSHVDCSSEKNLPNSKSNPQNWHMGPGKVLYGDLSHARATTTLGFCQRRIYGFSINFVTEMWHFTIICCGDTCVHNRIFVVILV